MIRSKKVVIVTGASKGIGKAIAEACGQEGMKVVIFARNANKLNEVADLMMSKGIEVLPIVGDVTNDSSINSCIEQTISKFGRIDALINNAGTSMYKAVEETTNKEWNNLQAVNINGVFLFSKAVIPYMKKQCEGYIINISSDAGQSSSANLTAYCSSKYAVQGFTGALSQELRPFGIKVASVMPGITDTSMHDSIPFQVDKSRWLKPEDIANSIIHLLQTPDHVIVEQIIIQPNKKSGELSK
ncbi:SDR family NAD(P)-dependent oxidoreductase [Bacillus sp. A116_S68]|jgi:NADP-dependent 3-hydroxy acid dehydrogenase YdfG|nr:SDR family NAD(P)-dependent oxidoreductase [Bacillus sp. A116_S68]